MSHHPFSLAFIVDDHIFDHDRMHVIVIENGNMIPMAGPMVWPMMLRSSLIVLHLCLGQRLVVILNQ